jgi:type IV pilus assembly protein PilE
MPRSRGFTLIELMIVVGIVAILAAIAIPSYSEYVKRGRIIDAVSKLSTQRVKMEQYFQDNRSYAGACTAGSIAPIPDPTPYFTFTCNPAPALTTYTIVATGAASMTGFQYSVNETDTHTTIALPANWTNPAISCGWVLKQDGSC